MIVVAISIAPTARVAAILAVNAALIASAVAFAVDTFLASFAISIISGVAAFASEYTCRGFATFESSAAVSMTSLAPAAACADQWADIAPATSMAEVADAGARTAAAMPRKSSGTVP